MKKVYVVASCCSGKFYYKDEPTVLGVFEKYEDTKRFFDWDVSLWRGSLSNNYEDEVCEYVGENHVEVVYECTDFDEKEHRYMKISDIELNNMI